MITRRIHYGEGGFLPDEPDNNVDFAGFICDQCGTSTELPEDSPLPDACPLCGAPADQS